MHPLLPLLLLTAALPALDFERQSFPMPMRCDMALAIDADGDGDRDLIGICRSKLMAVRLPEGDIVELYDLDAGAMIHAVAVDMDGDGDEDVAFCRFQNPHLQQRNESDPAPGPDVTVGWFENIGSLDRPWPLHIVDREVHGSHGIAAGDLDGDGQVDLATANVSGPHFPRSLSWWSLADGERHFVLPEQAGPRPHYVAIADIDGDGRQDIAFGTGGGWSLHLNQVDGWQHIALGSASGGTNVAIADIDGDGKLDIVGSAGHGKGIRVFLNPDWREIVIDADIPGVHSLAAGDLDGDGRAEIVANSNKLHETRIYRLLADGSVAMQIIDSGNRQQSYGCCIVDVDGDGRLDIVLGGRGSDNLVWYRQQ